LGRVDVSIEPEGATIVLDGNVTEREPPGAPLWVEPGDHTLSANSADGTSSERKFSIAAGESETITLTVEHARAPEKPAPATNALPIEARSIAASPPNRERPTDNAARTWTLVGGGAVTAAAVAVGIAYLVDANALDNDAARLRAATETEGDPTLVKTRAQCTPPAGMRPPACDELKAKVNDSDSARIISTVGFVSAGVFAAATIGTYFLWPHDRPRASQGARPTVAPWSIGREGVGVQLLGNF
jgi:hypothetical protein